MFNLTEVRITKNHWSVWLLKFCFGITRRFNTYCEHFWLTILAVVLFPIIAPFKFIWIWLRFTFLRYVDYVEKQYDEKLLKQFQSLSEEELEEMRLMRVAYWKDLEDDLKLKHHSPKWYKKLSDKIRLNYNGYTDLGTLYWEKIGKKIDDSDNFWRYYETIQEQAAPKRTIVPPAPPSKFSIWFKSINWKSIFMWIGKYIAAPIVGLFIVIASGILVFYSYVFISYLWNTFYVNWVAVKIVAKIFGLYILPIAVVGIGTGLLFAKGIISLPDLPEVTIPEPVKNVFRFIFVKTIGGFFKGIGSIVLFLINGIKLFKSDNCPAIIWEDEKK